MTVRLVLVLDDILWQKSALRLTMFAQLLSVARQLPKSRWKSMPLKLMVLIVWLSEKPTRVERMVVLLKAKGILLCRWWQVVLWLTPSPLASTVVGPAHLGALPRTVVTSVVPSPLRGTA